MRPALRSLRIIADETSLLRNRRCRLHPYQYRPFSISQIHHEQHQKPKDDNTLQGYYADLLDAPLHSVQNATKTAPEPPPTDNLPMTSREETLAKARVVFGSRLAGPEERQKELESQSQWIAGVMVPPKPEEPDNCCMSGCVNCVWERYREELEDWATASTEARRKMIEQRTRGTATGMMQDTAASGGPAHTMISMDDDGGGSETNWAQAPETEALIGEEEATTDPLKGIPVGIREFMKTEKKLKERHRAKGEIMDTALDKDLRAQVWGAGARGG